MTPLSKPNRNPPIAAMVERKITLPKLSVDIAVDWSCLSITIELVIVIVAGLYIPKNFSRIKSGM
jgi:hypothetical protein